MANDLWPHLTYLKFISLYISNYRMRFDNTVKKKENNFIPVQSDIVRLVYYLKTKDK